MQTKTSRHPLTPHVGDSVSSSESRRADARRHPRIPPTRRIMKPSKPITISDEIAARYTNTDQFERFDAAVSRVLSVPREELLRREDEYKRQSLANPNRRGPKPKRKPAGHGPAVSLPS